MSTGKVYLIGAGPGDPDLLTVKAARLLGCADVVLHDGLVTPAVLGLAGAGASIVNVGKRCGARGITQEQINALMIEHARRGASVARLKSGDPLVFGRAAEEMDALNAAGVSFEVIPGITAAFAAAAALGCSLTDRRLSSSIMFSSGPHAASHTRGGQPLPDEPTRAVYMPGKCFAALAEEWKERGLPEDYPCVVLSRAAQPDQQIHRTTLGALAQFKPGPAPVLVLAGYVFAHLPVDADGGELILPTAPTGPVPHSDKSGVV